MLKNKDFADDFYFFSSWEDYSSLAALQHDISKTESIEAYFKLLKSIYSKRNIQREVDFSKSLIFALGNLDEAFFMAKNINPDMPADDFAEMVNKVTVVDVKTSLQKRFRNEQIARMGHNQIVYPVLNSNQFEQVITNKLNQLQTMFVERFYVSFEFDESVVDILYKEMVIPTQGVRPILGDIDRRMGKVLSEMVVNVKEMKEHAKLTGKTVLEVSYKDGRMYGVGENKLRVVISFPLVMQALRKPKADDAQAVTAVHEVGHAIAHYVLTGIPPKSVVTATSRSEVAGFVSLDLPLELQPKKLMINVIKIMLAGRAAEIEVFGEDWLTIGAEHDLMQATAIMSKMHRRWGMGNNPYSSDIEFEGNEMVFYGVASHMAIDMRDEMEKLSEEVVKLLRANKEALLRIAKVLSVRGSISGNEFVAMFEEYSDAKVERNTAEGYFPAKGILERKFKSLSNN